MDDRKERSKEEANGILPEIHKQGYDLYGSERTKSMDERKECKERKTYTAEESRAYLDSRATSGRKGLKLPRVNCAFTPETYQYIRTMSKIQGMSMTEFINLVIVQHMKQDAHKDLYEQAKRITEELAGKYDQE